MATPVLNYTAVSSVTGFCPVSVPGQPFVHPTGWPRSVAAPIVGGKYRWAVPLWTMEPMMATRGVAQASRQFLRVVPHVAANVLFWRARWRPRKGQLWPRTR